MFMPSRQETAFRPFQAKPATLKRRAGSCPNTQNPCFVRPDNLQGSPRRSTTATNLFTISKNSNNLTNMSAGFRLACHPKLEGSASAALRLRSSASRRDVKSPRVRLRRTGLAGGADRDRTGDLLLAKQALSHLSYGPGFRRQKSEVRRGHVVWAPGFLLSSDWWAWVDSNYRPHAYQACALTA